MKKFFSVLLFCLLTPFVCAKTADSKNYALDKETAFVLALSSIDKLNFKIEEVQSSSGYILFKSPSGDEYLLVVSEFNKEISNIKISKVKPSSPLAEIQEIIFTSVTNNLNNLPKRADL